METASGQLVVKGVCCRKWPLLAMTRIGKCGLCGERPEVVGLWLESDSPKKEET